MEKERKDTADKLLLKNKNVRINNDYHYFPSLSTKDDYSDCDKYIKQLINSYDIELNDKIIAVDNDINLKIFTENKNLNE